MEDAPELFKESTAELETVFNNHSVSHQLVNEFLNSAQVKEEKIDGYVERVAVWEDDVFASSEAIISLSQYILSPSTRITLEDKHRILDVLKLALRYLELEQIDGRWGIEEVTAVALRAYIVGYHALGNELNPKPHIIFKGIRYLCDKKTTFSDGSVAHELEPTVYYTLALLEAIQNWRLPDGLCEMRPVIDLYDYIIWNTPVRTSLERALRLQGESELRLLRESYELTREQLNRLSHQQRRSRNLSYFAFWSVIGFILITMLLPDVSIVGVTLTSPLMQIGNWEVLLGAISMWTALGWFVFNQIRARDKV